MYFEVEVRSHEDLPHLHAIEFGSEPVPPHDSFLRDLAAQNRGQYQYVDVRALQAPAAPELDAESDQ